MVIQLSDSVDPTRKNTEKKRGVSYYIHQDCLRPITSSGDDQKDRKVHLIHLL